MDYMSIVKWWQDKNLHTVDDYKTVLDNFQILFTCNSNNIEGSNISYHTTREIFEERPLSASGLTPRDIFEVRNQKFAFEFLLKALMNSVPIGIDFIKKLHYLLMYGSYDEIRWRKGERPGQFKVGDYCVGMTDEGSCPDEVVEDLSEVVEEINSTTGDILTIATYFHLKLESIHPFADGNGRVGRTLLNYFLMLHNYPPMVIYNEDKNTYYLGLEVFDRIGEISGMRDFFKEQTIKTWKNRMGKPKYTKEQIELARELAPSVYKDKTDDELWELVGNYVSKLQR